MKSHPDRANDRGDLKAVLRALAFVVVLVPRPGLLQADERPGDSAREERLHAMQRIAGRVTIQTDASDGRRAVERLPEPSYKFVDPTRQHSDGSIWTWGRSGRPVALLTVSTWRSGAGDVRWLCELTSLAPVPLASSVGNFQFWAPETAGVEPREFPTAPPAAAEEGKRMRQMKELARRFKAYEYFSSKAGSTPERYELRLMPQPIQRYSEPATGLIDGALFLLSYGTNPEVVVLIETRQSGQSEPRWTYGLARIAGAELHVEVDEHEVWTKRRVESTGPRETYWFYNRPLDGGP